MFKHILLPIGALCLITWQSVGFIRFLFMAPNDPAFPLLAVALVAFFGSAWALVLSTAVIYLLTNHGEEVS